MVIDTHIRPALFSPICENKERFEKRCDQMNYHLMKPSSIELLKKQYALAGIEKVFLLPSDCSFETGEPDISNDEIEKIVQCDPTFFVGFASADPRKESAAEELEKAFKFQNLAGLYINTARLHMYPCDERLFVLYDICKKYKRPIIFQAGLSMENNSLAKYCRPIEFEEVLSKYPEVNICLSHVGWPWVQETAALLLKYENCYTNTALMNFDGPYHHNHYLPTYGTIGGNAPGHLKSLLTGNHCVFPVLDGTLKLGHAVDIYFCEYDGIKNRRYMVYVVGERG